MKWKALLLTALVISLIGCVLLVVQAQESTPIPDDSAAGEIVDLTVQVAEDAATTVQGWLDRLLAVPQSEVMRILMVLGGLLLLVAGWRIYDYIVVIAGFLIGASIALSLVTSSNSLIQIGALLIGGLAGAILGIFLYYAAIFLIGAYIGITLTGALASALSLTPVSALVLIIGAVIGGAILIGLSFQFLVVLSAIVGAEMLARAFGLDSVWTLVFAVVGVIVQFGLMRTYRYDFRRHRRPYIFRRNLG